MITGYNTDVEHGGIVYHVQTEDKGLQTPIILSLVYIGGAILASKRAPYDDLIAGGFDEQILVDRLRRQHKLICAAVHAGRIEDLKRMGEREAATVAAARERSLTADKVQESSADEVREADQPGEEVDYSSSGPDFDDAPLTVKLINRPRLRGGKSVVLKLLVTRVAKEGRTPAANLKLVLKILGTDFPTSTIDLATNDAGMAVASVPLPEFSTGRAAILVQAEDNGVKAELRRIILPNNE
ncbi:MAG: hypothetical protein ABR607_04075 [Pyrinomonadaceae bacterium]